MRWQWRELARPLREGDVLVRKVGRAEHRYVVIGFSPWGKVQMLNPNGGITSTWWGQSIPDMYEPFGELAWLDVEEAV